MQLHFAQADLISRRVTNYANCSRRQQLTALLLRCENRFHRLAIEAARDGWHMAGCSVRLLLVLPSSLSLFPRGGRAPTVPGRRPHAAPPLGRRSAIRSATRVSRAAASSVFPLALHAHDCASDGPARWVSAGQTRTLPSAASATSQTRRAGAGECAG